MLLALPACSNPPPLRALEVSVEKPVTSPVSAAPAESARLPPPPPAKGSLPRAVSASAGPITFDAAAPDARWVVFCQARHDTDGDGKLRVGVGPQGELNGDRLVRYLALDSGAEEPIDDMLTSSADGRFIATRVGRQSQLIDTANGVRVDLSAMAFDARRDPSGASGHRAIVIDEAALFFVRSASAQFEIVERSLVDASEVVLYRSAEPIWRIELDGTRRALIATVPGADVNGNGRFDAPYLAVDTSKPCTSPVPRFQVPRVGVDPFGFIVIDRATRSATRVDDLAIVFGGGVLRRELSGALVVERAGLKTALVDAACKGRVLWADPGRDQLLIGCPMANKPGRASVELIAAGKRSTLGIQVASLGFDEPVPASVERLVPLYPGADTVLFDADKKVLRRLHAGDLVLGTSGARALIRRAGNALIYDADTESETVLTGILDRLPVLLRRGPLVFSSPLLVDLGIGDATRSITGRPLALANSGAVLLPVSPATNTELAEGPLTWD